MSNQKIRIEIENYGTIEAELYPEKAPNTVKNFVELIEKGFFSGKIFHRIIEGFMIQGGGYDIDFNHCEAKAIRGEFRANGFPQNTLKHARGVLSMARTSAPNSASSQFFVMHANAPHLDGQYAGFGMLTDGFDVLDQIASVKTGRYGYFSDVPREPIVIDRIEVVEE